MDLPPITGRDGLLRRLLRAERPCVSAEVLLETKIQSCYTFYGKRQNFTFCCSFVWRNAQSGRREGIRMMKKFLSLSFGLLLLVSLASCGESNPETAEDASDRKTVENETFTITGKDYDDAGELYTFEVEGQYSGQILNDVPDGQGTFICQKGDGNSWTYSGEFKNGVFNGKGETTWSDTKWKEAGTYTDGLFTPNTFEMFDSLSASEVAPYTISEQNQEFMESHLELFPAETEAAQQTMSSLIQEDLTLSHDEQDIKRIGRDALPMPIRYCNTGFTKQSLWPRRDQNHLPGS